ncbi:hypothetical protein [Paenibacillus amylolyticus]|uniref:hypothetical protein n=1 Tax=Paenibacillus TaxID=44249 RepID=UPI000FDB4E57|nr:hypothetical protein [Paenibacillus amylolyticus]
MDTRILEVKTILILLGSWRICCDGAGWDRFFVWGSCWSLTQNKFAMTRFGGTKPVHGEFREWSMIWHEEEVGKH